MSMSSLFEIKTKRKEKTANRFGNSIATTAILKTGLRKHIYFYAGSHVVMVFIPIYSFLGEKSLVM